MGFSLDLLLHRLMRVLLVLSGFGIMRSVPDSFALFIEYFGIVFLSFLQLYLHFLKRTKKKKAAAFSGNGRQKIINLAEIHSAVLKGVRGIEFSFFLCGKIDPLI